MQSLLPRSRRLIALVIIAALSLTAFASAGYTQTRPAGAAHVTVKIVKYKYMPPNLTIKRGTVVTFINQDDPNHSITADNGAFNIAKLGPGESKSVTFKKAGTFKYHCTFHPFMVAKITVK